MISDKNLQNVTELIKQHEGFRETAYLDTEDNLTIGYGFNVNYLVLNESISSEILTSLVRESIVRLEREPWFLSLSDNRKIVIIDMHYNLSHKLFYFKKMISALEKSDFTAATKEMLNSKWATQVKSRALFLACLMLTDRLCLD